MQVLDHGFIELQQRTGHPGPMVVAAARCSYGSTGDEMGDKDQALVRYLLDHGHTSPFRHVFFTFHVKAPLFVFRQWWKYQVGSTWREYEIDDGTPLSSRAKCDTCGGYRKYSEWFGPADNVDCSRCGHIVRAIDIMTDTDQGCSWNELSGRYKVMEPEFYLPEKARANTGRQSANGEVTKALTDTLRGALLVSYDQAMSTYNELLDYGVAKELARLVLPPSIYSECYWTVSLQAVLHFLDQRLKPRAQFEIRQYAQGVLELIKPELEAMGLDIS